MPFSELRRGKVFFQTVDIPYQKDFKGCLVFIHGAGGDHQRWVRQMKSGVPDWKSVAVDLPGHGASEGEPMESITVYAEVLRDLIELNTFPRPVILVGHSMGGSIALKTALNYSESVDGLVLIGSGARMPVNEKMLGQLKEGTFNPGFLKIAYGPNVQPSFLQQELALLASVPQQKLYKDFMACNLFDVSERLAYIEVPTLILVGDQDKMTPVKASQFLNKNITNSILKIIPGAGHHLMLENPEATNQAIYEFLNKRFL